MKTKLGLIFNLLLVFSGCSIVSSDTPIVYLNQPTEVKFSHEVIIDFSGKTSIKKEHIIIECKKLENEILAIRIAPKEDSFWSDGYDYFQINGKGEVISAITEDLKVKYPNDPYFSNRLGADVGESRTGYLTLHPGVASIEFRLKVGDSRKAMFVIQLKDKE